MLERAGIQRADLVVAVTGDDEDNLLICQVAKEKYLCERIIARVNNPRNLEHFKLLGIQPAVSATDLILRLIEHEVPRYGLVHLLDLPEERLEIIELVVAEDAPAAGQRVAEHGAARRRAGDLGAARRRGFVPKADTVVEAGDEVLVVLDPGLEEDITRQFVGQRRAWLTATSTSLIVGGGAGRRVVRRGAARGAASSGSVLLVGPRARPAVRAPAAPRRTTCAASIERDDALPAPDATGTAEHGDRAAHAHERDEARHRRRATADAVDQGRSSGSARALLATGANVRRLRVDGGQLEGIHYLRALGNADAIRADAEDAERVVLVGGSYIACEVAASLTALRQAAARW